MVGFRIVVAHAGSYGDVFTVVFGAPRTGGRRVAIQFAIAGSCSGDVNLFHDSRGMRSVGSNPPLDVYREAVFLYCRLYLEVSLGILVFMMSGGGFASDELGLADIVLCGGVGRHPNELTGLADPECIMHDAVEVCERPPIIYDPSAATPQGLHAWFAIAEKDAASEHQYQRPEPLG